MLFRSKARRMGKIFGGSTLALTAVVVVVMALSLGATVASGGAASPLLIASTAMAVAAFGGATYSMASDGNDPVSSMGADQAAQAILRGSKALGLGLNESEAQMIASAVLAALLAAGGGAAGASKLGMLAIGLAVASQSGFFEAAGESTADALGQDGMNAMWITMAFSMAGAIASMGAGGKAAMAEKGSKGATVAKEAADETATATQQAKVAVDDAVQKSTTAVEKADKANAAAETARKDPTAVNIKAADDAAAESAKANKAAEVANKTADDAVAELDKAKASQWRKAFDSVDEASPIDKLFGTSPTAKMSMIDAMDILSPSLSKAYAGVQIAAAATQVTTQSIMGVNLLKVSEMQDEMAEISARMHIFNTVAEMQMGLSASTQEEYSNALQGLNANTSASLQAQADGQATLANVLGGQSA